MPQQLYKTPVLQAALTSNSISVKYVCFLDFLYIFCETPILYINKNCNLINIPLICLNRKPLFLLSFFSPEKKRRALFEGRGDGGDGAGDDFVAQKFFHDEETFGGDGFDVLADGRKRGKIT